MNRMYWQWVLFIDRVAKAIDQVEQHLFYDFYKFELTIGCVYSKTFSNIFFEQTQCESPCINDSFIDSIFEQAIRNQEFSM